MKIVIDNKIPYIKGALEPFAEVVYLPGAKTTADDIKDADAIITRTRTICDEKLLKGSKVKFIATATIGYDHIDTEYCAEAGIEWTNAPGCNSKSVEQYIASALTVLFSKNQEPKTKNQDVPLKIRGIKGDFISLSEDISSKSSAFSESLCLKNLTIGIVGVGNVGSKVAGICELMGMKVLLNDPPRARFEGKDGFVELDEILERADIITLHTPLNMEGEDKTFHLADKDFFLKAKKSPVLINSCRGEVVDTESLKDAINSGNICDAVIDCWEHEPRIDTGLLELTTLATPHIAGYSKDGKANGTAMSVQSVSRFFNLGIDNWQCKNVELPDSVEISIDGRGKSVQQIFEEAILATYDIREDDKRLRNSVETFEKQRGGYPVRREFTSYKIYASNIDDKTIEKLEIMGFKIVIK